MNYNNLILKLLRFKRYLMRNYQYFKKENLNMTKESMNSIF